MWCNVGGDSFSIYARCTLNLVISSIAWTEGHELNGGNRVGFFGFCPN